MVHRVFQRQLAPVEIMSEASLEMLERGWKRIVSEIGIEFDHEGAIELFRKHGQKIEGQVVHLDPEFMLEQIAKIPKSFTWHSRNPERDIDFAPDRMAFLPVNSAPFVREGDRRYEATFEAFRRFNRLTYVTDELDSPGCPSCDPTDGAIDSRHLSLQLALYEDQDKPQFASAFDGTGAADSINMAAIVAGGRDALIERPTLAGVINCNSPLRYDIRMLDSLFEMASAGQIVIVTPFILMGAMGPVSVPAALAQQTAESLAALTLVQLVRPGCPAIMGSFVSHTDMQSGSPGFGGPESAVGILATGQIARRYGLLWRSGGGGLTSAQVVDAQAAFESLNTMLPAFMAGANFQLHTAGWMESGLVACFEKFALDIEILRILQREFTPLEIDEESLAFSAHQEVGHGGHFFGAAHTLERFRECFYRPMVFSTENFDRWTRYGSLDTAARAAKRWPEWLEKWSAPPLDDGIHQELVEYVARRTTELGDD
jgi:trimethylamine--corrinoid protein Co-methyltransferase